MFGKLLIRGCSPNIMDPLTLNREYRLDLFDLQKTVKEIDLSLKDLFDIVYEAEIRHEGVAEALGMPNFMEFYEEINKKKENDRVLHYLELYWGVNHDIMRNEQGKLEEVVDKAELSPQMEFHGIGKHWDDFPYDCPEDCHHHNGYGIEFSSLRELGHLPIRMNTIIQYKKMKIESHPSLYQVLNSVFWELTFVGYHPEHITQKRDELDQIKTKAEDELLKREGTAIIKDMIGKGNPKKED